MKWIICFFIVSVSLLNACKKDCHETIAFINYSSKDVYIDATSEYPDTLNFYHTFPNPCIEPSIYKVKSGEKNTDALWRRRCYEKYIANGWTVIYVFDAETLETIPWDTIGKYYMVLKTIHPSMEEMESNNWTITYTGE